MKIEFLTKKYVPSVITLWKETFGDNEGFINDFFDFWTPESHTMILREEKCVLGMLSLLPVSANGRSGKYIYAVATDKNFRKCGGATKLLKAADDFALKNGDGFSVLVPSNDTLFDFYKKRGWNKILYAPDFFDISLGVGLKEAKQISLDEYYKARRKFFDKKDLIEWDLYALSYMKNCGNAIKAGETAAFLWDNKPAEVLSEEVFLKDTKPFALIKFYNDFSLNAPYFGIAMN